MSDVSAGRGPELRTRAKRATGLPGNSNDGGDHVDRCALPGFDARYLTRAPGFNPGWNLKTLKLNRICQRAPDLRGSVLAELSS
jgi:hypothetical protein